MRDHVLTTISLIAAARDLDEAELVNCLCSFGYKTLQAELLVVFVPLGLARAIIRRVPAVDIQLSDHVLVLRAGKTLEVPLMWVPEFVEALRLGEETFTTGIIPKEALARVTQLSVELNLINTVLFAGKTPANISAPILLRLGELAEFDEWYSQIKGPSLP